MPDTLIDQAAGALELIAKRGVVYPGEIPELLELAEQLRAGRPRTPPHFVSAMYLGESCGPCRREGRSTDATHKIGEEIAFDDPSDRDRHNLTQYVCCEHYARLMGPLAERGCGVVLRPTPATEQTP